MKLSKNTWTKFCMGKDIIFCPPCFPQWALAAIHPWYTLQNPAYWWHLRVAWIWRTSQQIAICRSCSLLPASKLPMGQSAHQGTYFCLICGTWKNAWNGMIKGQENGFPIDPDLVDILADMDFGWENISSNLRIPSFWILADFPNSGFPNSHNPDNLCFCEYWV